MGLLYHEPERCAFPLLLAMALEELFSLLNINLFVCKMGAITTTSNSHEEDKIIYYLLKACNLKLETS